MSWRDEAAPIIRRVLHNMKGRSEAEIKRALFEAYPFGERAHWPYKVWLDEIKRQRNPNPVRQYRQRVKNVEVPKDQMELF